VSPPRSGRGASRPAARTTPGRPGVFVQKPRSDIYVALLATALGAILLGCLFLVLHLNSYEFELKASARSTPAPPTALAAAPSENLSTVRL